MSLKKALPPPIMEIEGGKPVVVQRMDAPRRRRAVRAKSERSKAKSMSEVK
jgi:hypothetical protein